MSKERRMIEITPGRMSPGGRMTDIALAAISTRNTTTTVRTLTSGSACVMCSTAERARG